MKKTLIAALSLCATLADALAPGAPLVWPEATGNVAVEMRHGDAAATDEAFGRAKHRVAIDLVNQRVIPCPIEPRATLAVYDAGSDRNDLCNEVLGIAPDKVRIVVGDVGGGFGMKTALYAEDCVAAYCARQWRRPLKWCADRTEEFLAASHGRDLESHAELALDADGRILALRVMSHANLGAYATPSGVVYSAA